MSDPVRLTAEQVDQRWENLLRAAKLVSNAFGSGHHPSEGQLQRLQGAIDAIDMQKVCGHRLIEDCSCFEEYR